MAIKIYNISSVLDESQEKIVIVQKLINGNYSVIVESSSNTFSEDDYEISDITLCELRKFLWETFKIGVEDD